MNWIVCCGSVVLAAVLSTVECERKGKEMGIAVCILTVLKYLTKEYDQIPSLHMVFFYIQFAAICLCLVYMIHKNIRNKEESKSITIGGGLLLILFIVRRVFQQRYIVNAASYISYKKGIAVTEGIVEAAKALSIVELIILAGLVGVVCMRKEQPSEI